MNLKNILTLSPLIVLFALPFISHADTRFHFRSIHLSPTTPPVVVSGDTGILPKGGPSGFCMNALHDNPTTAAAIMAEIKAVKAAGFNCVRLAYQNFNNPDSEQGALDAKSLGMYVILGAEWGNFTQSQFSQYESEALTQFKWCQANGIQQCSEGNEEEYRLSGVSYQQWGDDLRTIASAARDVYSGTISYETSGDFTQEWSAQSLGDIGLLGLNLYCNYQCNANYLQEAINAFGVSHVYVSETGPDMSMGKYGTDALRAAERDKDRCSSLSQEFPLDPDVFLHLGRER